MAMLHSWDRDDTHLGEAACDPGLAGAVFLSILLLVLWGGRTNHSLVSVGPRGLVVWGGRAGRFPECPAAWALATLSSLGHGGEVPGIRQTSKIRTPVPSGSEAAKCPRGLPPSTHVRKRSSDRGNEGGGG